ncbi:pentapeptide repeat-containing protein [Kineococcus rubinsiae]|uniref:pentapeptide repeat-containing protein n=1 Tax=Kineococcus rubinsiae TaxID=2609562 RepID=UPI0014315924|nr:pentapeptide repeat-containing protein [Kineococcus rubinsiae]
MVTRRPDRETPRPPSPDVGELVPAPGPPAATRSHDGLEYRDVDLSGVDARDARFLGCAFTGCRCDDLDLAGARLVDCTLDATTATTAAWRSTTWQDVTVDGFRFGALALPAADLTRVRFSAGRVDFANLRDTTFTDVVFAGCDLRELDAAGARWTRVRFEDCRIGHLDVHAATLTAVDLSAAELEGVAGVGGLRGARISDVQLLQLAPAFAEHLGVRTPGR